LPKFGAGDLWHHFYSSTHDGINCNETYLDTLQCAQAISIRLVTTSAPGSCLGQPKWDLW